MDIIGNDNLHDLGGGDADDDSVDSFKSALEMPISESFMIQSSSVSSPPIDNNPSNLEFVHVHDDHDDFTPEMINEKIDGSELSKDGQTYDTGHSDTNIETAVSKDEEGQGKVERKMDNEQDESSHISATPTNDNQHQHTWKVITEETETERPTPNSLSFNQDKTCVAIATSSGYRIRTVPHPANTSYNNSDKDGETSSASSNIKVHQVKLKNGTSQIKMLYCTSLLCIVQKSSPRTLKFVHAKNSKVVRELPFVSAIRRVEMNRKVIVVLTADGVLYIFHFINASEGRNNNNKFANEQGLQDERIQFVKSFNILHSSESARMITDQNACTTGAFFDLAGYIETASSGSNGEVSPSSPSWLVTKSEQGVGMISVYDTNCSYDNSDDSAAGKSTDSVRLVKTFQAHTHGITRVAIGGNCSSSESQTSGKNLSVFATASLKGTKIRVFSLPQCETLYQLQRGSSPRTIFSLSFNFCASHLAASSSNGTVHIFRLSKEEEERVASGNSNGDDDSAGNSTAAFSTSSNHTWRKSLSSPFKNFFHDFKSTVGNTIAYGSNVATAPTIMAIRSYAKIRIKSDKVGGPKLPNTIAMLNGSSALSPIGQEEEHLVVCLGNAKLYQFAIGANGKSRPIRAEDMLFDDESVL